MAGDSPAALAPSSMAASVQPLSSYKHHGEPSSLGTPVEAVQVYHSVSAGRLKSGKSWPSPPAILSQAQHYSDKERKAAVFGKEMPPGDRGLPGRWRCLRRTAGRPPAPPWLGPLVSETPLKAAPSAWHPLGGPGVHPADGVRGPRVPLREWIGVRKRVRVSVSARRLRTLAREEESDCACCVISCEQSRGPRLRCC